MRRIIFSLLLTIICSTYSFAYNVEVDGIYYNVYYNENSQRKEAEVKSGSSKYSGKVIIPEKFTYEGVEYSVTSIGSSAFYNCSGLTSVTIPNSVTSIEYDAFEGCSGLTSITIPNSVTSIGSSAFYNCSGLTSVTIPNSVTSIGSSAFKYCSNLTSVTIPNSVTSIGSDAFEYCNNLKKAEFGSIESLCAISFGNYCSNPLYYAHSLYIDGNEIKDLVIPNSVTSIRDEAFRGCSGLTSVTIGNSVTSIGSYAFSGCSNVKELIYEEGTKKVLGTGITSITSVTISSTAEEIKKDAFYNCYKLEHVKCLATTPPTCQSNVFKVSTASAKDVFDVYNYAILHVHLGCKEAYSLAGDWRYFKNIKEDASTGNSGGNANEEVSLEINQCAGGYVRVNIAKGKSHTILISPEGMNSINTVLFNGKNVTSDVNNGSYTTPVLNESSRLVVSYEIFNTKAKNLNDGDVSNISVYGIDNILHITGVNKITALRVYDTNGTMIESSTISGDANLQLPNGIYIVKVGQRTFKVSM